MGNQPSSGQPDPTQQTAPNPDPLKRSTQDMYLPHHTSSRSKLQTSRSAKSSMEALDPHATGPPPVIIRSQQYDETLTSPSTNPSMDDSNPNTILNQPPPAQKAPINDDFLPTHLSVADGAIPRPPPQTTSRHHHLIPGAVESTVVGAGGAIVGALESVGRGVMGSFMSLSRKHGGQGGKAVADQEEEEGVGREGADGMGWGFGGVGAEMGAGVSQASGGGYEELRRQSVGMPDPRQQMGRSRDLFAMEAGEAPPPLSSRNSVSFIPPSQIREATDTPPSGSRAPRKPFPMKSAALNFVGGPLSNPGSLAPSRAGSNTHMQHVGVQLANQTVAAQSALAAPGGGGTASRRGSAFSMPQPANLQTEIGVFPGLQQQQQQQKSHGRGSYSGETISEGRKNSVSLQDVGRLGSGNASTGVGSTPLRRVMNANPSNGASIDSMLSSTISSTTQTGAVTPNTPSLLEAGLGASRRSSTIDQSRQSSRQTSLQLPAHKLAELEQWQQRSLTQSPLGRAHGGEGDHNRERESSPSPSSQPHRHSQIPHRQPSNPLSTTMRNRSTSSDSYHPHLPQKPQKPRSTQSPMPQSPTRRASTPAASSPLKVTLLAPSIKASVDEEEKGFQHEQGGEMVGTSEEEVVRGEEKRKEDEKLFENLQKAPALSRHPHGISKFNSCSTLFVESTLMSADLGETLRSVSYALVNTMTQSAKQNRFMSVDILLEKSHPLSRHITFHTRSPSANDIFKFLECLFHAADLYVECAIITLVYIDRMLDRTGVTLGAGNWTRTVLGGLMLASKVWDDHAVWNVDFVQIFPDVGVEDLNDLERFYLAALGYDVSVRASVYARYYFLLRDLGERRQRSWATKPLMMREASRLEPKQPKPPPKPSSPTESTATSSTSKTQPSSIPSHVTDSRDTSEKARTSPGSSADGRLGETPREIVIARGMRRSMSENVFLGRSGAIGVL
ncbi:hypothetical protein HK097_008518 [Rhizophlyctis rosea]|uniref:Cyclin N-terminal domain-containing protein n=1 Tax=Rhizophlyctis rosea TaxID=64517 RepID=A0AAD5SCY6_9FUNG|nr:hypothetical protein HK097_008518 [Rhizophlyctis rosea]